MEETVIHQYEPALAQKHTASTSEGTFVVYI